MLSLPSQNYFHSLGRSDLLLTIAQVQNGFMYLICIKVVFMVSCCLCSLSLLDLYELNKE